MSLIRPSEEIFKPSIDSKVKFAVRAFSISEDLKTPFSLAPVMATLTLLPVLAIKTPTIAYLDAGLGNFIYEDLSGIGKEI